MTKDALWQIIVAPTNAGNPRNSEADIIPLQDGKLLLGWTEFYAASGADHAPARLVGRVSADEGRSWGDKYTLVENDGGCNVMEVNFIRLKSGAIALLHCQKNSEHHDARIMMRTSSDEGQTFGPAEQLSRDNSYTGLTNGRCIRLGSGRILLPAWEGGASYCCVSDDDGVSWHDGQRARPEASDTGRVPDGQEPQDKHYAVENACVELKDASVMMLMRTGLDGQYKSISTDGGETWSAPVSTQLSGTPAPVAISRIPTTGDLLAIWNNNLDTPAARGNRDRKPLTAAVSEDEGVTWGHFRNLEEHSDEADAWAYPAVTWVPDRAAYPRAAYPRALVTYFGYYSNGLPLILTALSPDWFYG